MALYQRQVVGQEALDGHAAPEPGPEEIALDRPHARAALPGPKGLSDALFDGLGCDSDAIAGTAVYEIVRRIAW
ncbi:hypothetical protein ACTMTI_51665 [Nonomuraea sp. H19]|uniref:hypothetical protein n=1 Tax=Nonomuraea sp. H19 TaxID=3452206 RepID=UPI003F8CA562